MRSALVWVVLVGCEAKPRSTAAPVPTSGSAAVAVHAIPDAAAPDAAARDAALDGPSVANGPALPAGVHALVATEPLPTVAYNDLLLLAATPGGVVTLETSDGKRLEVRDGLIAKAADQELPGGLTHDEADRAEVVDPGDPPHTAQLVTRAETSNDFVHREVWFVPTVGTRQRLAEDASEIEVDWSDPLRRWAVVMLDHRAMLVDVKTAAARPLGDRVGSPSYAADGTLYYRTLDGRAWRWTGEGGETIGKGRRGKDQTGDLNDGIEPARYPPPVTFDKAGRPVFR